MKQCLKVVSDSLRNKLGKYIALNVYYFRIYKYAWWGLEVKIDIDVRADNQDDHVMWPHGFLHLKIADGSAWIGNLFLWWQVGVLSFIYHMDIGHQ